MPIKERITEEEAAKKLGKAKRTLRLWRERNQGPPYVRIGIAIWYEVEDIEAWITSTKVYPESNAS